MSTPAWQRDRNVRLAAICLGASVWVFAGVALFVAYAIAPEHAGLTESPSDQILGTIAAGAFAALFAAVGVFPLVLAVKAWRRYRRLGPGAAGYSDDYEPWDHMQPATPGRLARSMLFCGFLVALFGVPAAIGVYAVIDPHIFHEESTHFVGTQLVYVRCGLALATSALVAGTSYFVRMTVFTYRGYRRQRATK